METYQVTVYHSKETNSCTLNNIYIKLRGEKGTSEQNWLSGNECYVGTVYLLLTCIVQIICKCCLDPFLKISPEDNWFPKKIEVKAPNGKIYIFPMYTWITDFQIHCFREGQGLSLTVNEDCTPLGKKKRSEELEQRKEAYRWKESERGLPDHVEARDPSQLPLDAQFTLRKYLGFGGVAVLDYIWTWFETFSEHYVKNNWRDDDFFGYQFLNGLNPMLIKCIKALPDNFHVTDGMISQYCKGNLDDEIKKGNIFLCDYKLLDGVETQEIHKTKQYLAAPLVLLYKTPKDKLVPIAIQLQQKPAADNPIFLPSDSQYDWLLAKIYVRSAEFNLHQLNFHLLRTHLLAEVFAVSLLRNLPMVHPLYKLLIPHTRYTLNVNVLARNYLISPNGFAASGGDGMYQILKRSLSSLTYTSLCIHDDIKERGMENIPNFYYRDDGCRLWDILHSPYQNFMTTFCSPQYDFGGWMPNLPSTMQCPPPTEKGKATEETIMAALPNKYTTCKAIETLFLLTQQYSDFVKLGDYPEEHFTEEKPRELIKKFQEDLRKLSEKIKERNKILPVPYEYLDPENVPNSVTI
uniref:Lipoxygenase domain-containing protein n=1 Tax=Fundulus heteroclitus TaxID=8078 RepID=A0A3Q2PR51_FUNHE